MLNRRQFLSAVGAAAGPTALWRVARAERPPRGQRRRPNVILLMADDCSAREFGCYGHPVHKTPVLDRLAETGVMFKTCWATPICSPSRAMIMTGRYGHRTGWFHNGLKPGPNEAGGNLGVSFTTFGELLRQAGYATAVCGKWQLRGTMAEHGFDEHCMWATPAPQGFDGPVETPELKGKKGAYIGRPARYWHPSIVRNGKHVPTKPDDYGPDLFVDFLLDFAKRHRDEPFLVYYPMCLTHKSWDFEAGRSGYLPVPEVDADGKRTGRKVPGSLRSNVAYTDHLVGRIVRGLERLGLRDDTVLLVTGDNGTAGYGKARVEQERGPRVPMIVNGPAVVRPRGAVDALVDFSDVLPTLCDLAGAKLPAGEQLDGKSFAPVLSGRADVTREWIFSCFVDKRMVRDGRFLLDGQGTLWDCGSRRDEQGYRDVTDSTEPDVIAAKKRFAKILAEHPAPTKEHMARWKPPRGQLRKRRAKLRRNRRD